MKIEMEAARTGLEDSTNACSSLEVSEPLEKRFDLAIADVTPLRRREPGSVVKSPYQQRFAIRGPAVWNQARVKG